MKAAVAWIGETVLLSVAFVLLAGVAAVAVERWWPRRTYHQWRQDRRDLANIRRGVRAGRWWE